jgi:hypothetical protein
VPPDPHGGPTPFDRRAYATFSLPRSMASAMAGLDRPGVVPGARAAHMRPDDLVIGLAMHDEGDGDDVARAYPIWIVDHYHVINDTLAGRRVVVTSCERCQTGSAFVADPPGPADREPLFRAGGVFCATLMMSDLRSGSTWNHYDGRPVRGRAATGGARLPWLPTLVTEWDGWRQLHPGSDVITAPEDPRHPDARHGHGREELFCRPGIDPAFLPTVVGPFDERYPEHELVLGVDVDEPRAYPLREVQQEGGVIHDDGLVVLAGPDAAGSAMRAFSMPPSLGELTRDGTAACFRDDHSGTAWTIEGVAIDGPMAGTRLEPIRSYTMRWHAWVYSRRRTSLFRSERAAPKRVRGAGRTSGDEGIDTLVRRWVEAGVDVEMRGPVTRQRRPRATIASLHATVDGSPVLVHRFEHLAGARDLEAFDGAWACDPFSSRVLPRRSVRMGPVVVQSDTWPRFVDPAQLVPVPASELPWPEAIDRLVELVPADLFEVPDGGPAFVDVLRGLRASGYEVLDPGLLPPAQLLPGCLDAIAATVEGDRFLWYRFADDAAASSAAGSIPTGHAMSAGTFVARSTPDTMYRHRTYEIDYAGDDVIRWSPLIDDARFLTTMRAACAPAAPATTSPPEEAPT